jgi:hypothetical protein
VLAVRAHLSSVLASLKKSVGYLIGQRHKANLGLLPPEQYAVGLTKNKVYALSSQLSAWRGLQNICFSAPRFGPVTQSEKYLREAEGFHWTILNAVDKSIIHGTGFSFIPNALLTNEQPYRELTESTLSGYYNQEIQYALEADVFGAFDPRTTMLLSYLQTHGGLLTDFATLNWPHLIN